MLGVWERGVFTGAVIFGMGANSNLGTAYGLTMWQTCELSRVALTTHIAPVTRIVSIALKMITRRCPGLRLVVSYADPFQGHDGRIYQAGNWYYVGQCKPAPMYIYRGRLYHGRNVTSTGWVRRFNSYERGLKQSECEKVIRPGKHKYLMPLDAAMRELIEPLRKPYPKRASVVEGTMPGYQPGGGGIEPDPDAPYCKATYSWTDAGQPLDAES